MRKCWQLNKYDIGKILGWIVTILISVACVKYIME